VFQPHFFSRAIPPSLNRHVLDSVTMTFPAIPQPRNFLPSLLLRNHKGRIGWPPPFFSVEDCCACIVEKPRSFRYLPRSATFSPLSGVLPGILTFVQLFPPGSLRPLSSKDVFKDRPVCLFVPRFLLLFFPLVTEKGSDPKIFPVAPDSCISLTRGDWHSSSLSYTMSPLCSAFSKKTGLPVSIRHCDLSPKNATAMVRVSVRDLLFFRFRYSSHFPPSLHPYVHRWPNQQVNLS